MSDNILEVEDLRVHFLNADKDRWAVDGITFSIKEGEILGLVGESGSGKTVTAMSISGLFARNSVQTSGSIRLCGREIFSCSEEEMLKMRGKQMGIVFQEPMTSMDPVMKIGKQVEESLLVHTKLDAHRRKEFAIQALKAADLPDPEDVYNKYPHELSGGMLQRCLIAAAIITKPKLLLADEPTTALDVTTQADILKLLQKLSAETGMSILFISHNLQVVRKLCTGVIVMQRGKIVESGKVEDVFNNPQHEYTKKLISAIPTRSRRISSNV